MSDKPYDTSSAKDRDGRASRRSRERRGDLSIKWVVLGSIAAIVAFTAAYHRDLKEKEKTIAELKKQCKCDQLEEELKRSKSDNEALSKQAKASEQRFQELVKENDQCKTSLEKNLDEIKKVKDSGLQRKVEEAENRLKQEQTKNNELQNELERLKLSLQGQTQKVDQAQQTLNVERERSKELAAEKKKCENNLQASKDEIRTEEKNNEVLQQKFDQIEAKLKEKEKQSAKCEITLADLTQKIKNLEDISRVDKQELFASKERIRELEERGGDKFRIDATWAKGYLRMHSDQGVCQVTVLRKDDPAVAERVGEGAITTTGDTEHIVDLKLVKPKIFTVSCKNQAVHLSVG